MQEAQFKTDTVAATVSHRGRPFGHIWDHILAGILVASRH